MTTKAAWVSSCSYPAVHPAVILSKIFAVAVPTPTGILAPAPEVARQVVVLRAARMFDGTGAAVVRDYDGYKAILGVENARRTLMAGFTSVRVVVPPSTR